LHTKSKIVVITGAESTGKSALSECISKRLGVPYLKEIAREYVENLNRPYNFGDIETIAREQVRQLSELQKEGHSVIFADTWLIITKIWFKEVYNHVPEWLETEIKKGPIDLFLVCDIDLPWVPDPVRENGGDRREYLQQCYINEIEKLGFRYKTVSGENETRVNNAIGILVQEGIIKPIKP